MEITIKNAVHQIEVEPRYMEMTLELFKEIWFKEEKELSFNVACTLVKIKKELMKSNPNNSHESEFTIKDMRAKLKVSPSSFSRHVNTLFDYNKLERTGGNKKDGYTYQVTNWSDTNESAKQYEDFKNEIQGL